MASDETRQDVVEENMADILDAYGEDAFRKQVIGMLKDINISLAMLVDNSGT